MCQHLGTGTVPPKLQWHQGRARPPKLCPTHEMASIMSTPISTQQCAWSPRASGSPDTQ